MVAYPLQLHEKEHIDKLRSLSLEEQTAVIAITCTMAKRSKKNRKAQPLPAGVISIRHAATQK